MSASTAASSSATAASSTSSIDSDPDVKIILLGDSAVGKSKLVERYLMNDFIPRQMSTYALTVFRHSTSVPSTNANANETQDDKSERKIDVDFWDTAGQERFSSMHPSYYHRAHCCILVFDVTRKLTYQHLEEWYKELQQYRPGMPILVTANKIDVDYEVVKKTFAFAPKHTHCIPNTYFASAADGTNVVKLFKDAIQLAINYKHNPHSQDFAEDVLETVDYFDKTEKQRAAEESKQKEATKAKT